MNLTKLLTVVTQNTLIFSLIVHQYHTKMLDINVKYRIAEKTCYFFIDLLLVFQKDLMIYIQTNWAINNIHEKNIVFFKKGR